MTPDKCPACGAKLRPHMLACPNCPMSFPEDDGPAGSDNPLKHSDYYKFLFPVLFLGAVGAGIWYLGTGLMRLGLANSEVENGNLFGGKNLAPRGAANAIVHDAAPGKDLRRLPAPKPADDEAIVMISHENDAAPPAPVRRARHEKTPKPAREWKLRGTVYDLATLAPLAGCALAFTDSETGRSVKTRTDSSGRYRTIVPPAAGEGGYAVTIEKSGYSSNYLIPGGEDLRKTSAGRRAIRAHELATTLAAPPATVRNAAGKPLVTDFYLAPR